MYNHLSSSPPSPSPPASPLMELPLSFPSPVMDLHLPLQELIFGGLPLRTVLAMSSSCKQFRSLVSSSPFAHLHALSPVNRLPWFFLFGFNFFLPQNNQAFAFDPLSQSWIRSRFIPPPLHNSSSLSAMNGVLFALAGAKQSQLCVAPSPLKQNWQVIEGSMAVSRKNPQVGVFVEDDVRAPDEGSCKIVVVGGVDDDCDEEDDKLAVEVFRAGKGRWERCMAMPEVLRGKSLCSAVVGSMFYVADREGGAMCRLDMKDCVWMEGKVQRPKEVKWWQVAGSEEELWAVGGGGGRAIKVYRMMVEETIEGGKLEVGMQEMAIMPEELHNAMFGGEEEEAAELRCCGGGHSRLYIYRDSRFQENVIMCVCDMSNRSWIKLPPLPAPLHRFDKALCLSSAISLSSVFSRPVHSFSLT